MAKILRLNTCFLFFPFILFNLIHCETSTTKERKESTVVERTSSSSINFEKPKLNVLEIFTGMGKAIQMVLNQNGIQISAVTRQDNGNFNNNSLSSSSMTYQARGNYQEQAELLRTEIARRAGTLQKIVVAAIEVLKDRGDVVVRRILENLNARLDQAKTRADKILKEPATSEMAIKTLNTINQGLSNINALIQQVLRRINVRINVDLNRDVNKESVQPPQSASTTAPTAS